MPALLVLQTCANLPLWLFLFHGRALPKGMKTACLPACLPCLPGRDWFGQGQTCRQGRLAASVGASFPSHHHPGMAGVWTRHGELWIGPKQVACSPRKGKAVSWQEKRRRRSSLGAAPGGRLRQPSLGLEPAMVTTGGAPATTSSATHQPPAYTWQCLPACCLPCNSGKGLLEKARPGWLAGLPCLTPSDWAKTPYPTLPPM